MVNRRTKLNQKQIALLKLVYKFRFVTAKLVAEHKGISIIAIHYAFNILIDHDLLAKRYDGSYKIHGRSASYYLTPKALRMLRDDFNLNEKVLHAMYKNKTVGDSFIDECLIVMQVYLALRKAYPDTFNIFTRSELGDFDYFPEPKSSLYLSRKEKLEGVPNDYMLDIFPDNRMFIIKKRIQTYVEHYDTGEWGEDEYPTILLVCSDSRTEEKAQKLVESLLEDFELLTTTKKALLNIAAKDANLDIWTNGVEPEKLVSL